MDTPTSNKILSLHPSIRARVTKAVNEANAALTAHSQMRIVQGLRTFAEQDALYKQRPKVTNAKGGQSIHNYGLAIDFCLILDGKIVSWDIKKDYDSDTISDWMEVVKAFKDLGFKWGGDWKSFKDFPHLEYIHEWRPLLDKYNKKDFIPGTTYVNL